ncbi:MAG: hypothetical protein U5O39_04325 [Gammaproteobacteria bacterium]|nr:hypothetical protein [Gammaproteobacteria bacterium]
MPMIDPQVAGSDRQIQSAVLGSLRPMEVTARRGTNNGVRHARHFDQGIRLLVDGHDLLLATDVERHFLT